MVLLSKLAPASSTVLSRARIHPRCLSSLSAAVTHVPAAAPSPLSPPSAAPVATPLAAASARKAFRPVPSFRPYSTASEPSGTVHQFRAETKRLLDIVAHSLYSEKEIFIRELISNGSDALEKLRYTEVTNSANVVNKSLPLEIRLYCDEEAKTFTIMDTGIGMKEEEAIQNLGTIAHSGSKAFLEKMSKVKEGTAGSGDNIIGQFGVGFYSAFMVGNKVTVYTKSATGGPGIEWTSDGSGEYTIKQVETIPRGTRIVIHLKEDALNFSRKSFVEGVIKKYSNFVGFPIYVNDEKVNTVQPLWTMSKDAVTADQHKEFYKYITGFPDEPMYHMHYSVDSPIMIRSLFYIPTRNPEKLTRGERLDPGVNLYSRKVLIKPKAQELLPEWLRFVRGVCDSEDIPLNLSREILQDSALIAKIRSTLTNRIVKWFGEEANRDPKKFEEWYADFENFFEEGIVSDPVYKDKIAPLLRLESSALPEGEKSTFDDYIKRAKEGQKKIYYLTGANYGIINSSPYMEQFKKNGLEVLFFTRPFGEFVMRSLHSYKDFELVAADSETLELAEDQKQKAKATEEQFQGFTNWMKDALKSQVYEVNLSTRLVSHPALIAHRENSMIMRYQQMVQNKKLPDIPNSLEVNPDHIVIKKLNEIRHTDPKFAEVVAHEVLDNAKTAAGIPCNPQTMLERWNVVLERALLNTPAEKK